MKRTMKFVQVNHKRNFIWIKEMATQKIVHCGFSFDKGKEDLTCLKNHVTKTSVHVGD